MTNALPTRAAWIGLLYLAAAFGFGRLGLPDVGFAVVALGATAVGVWILLRHTPPEPAIWLGVAVAAAMAIAPVLALLSGSAVGRGQLAFAIAVGVSVWAATLIPPATTRWSALGVLALVSWAGLAAGVLAMADVFSYGLFIEPAQDRALFGLDQLRGVMPHPNTMGIFAGIAVALGVRQVITDVADGVRGVGRIGGVIGLVILPSVLALVWSQSRTSAIAAGTGLVVALLPLGRRGWDWVPTAIAAAAGLMITVPVILTETTGYTFNGRDLPWSFAQTDFEAAPLFGAGPTFLTKFYVDNPNLPWYPETAHNLLMQAIGETGLLGLLTLAGLIIAMCVVAVRAVPFDRQWALIIVVTFCLLGGQESSLSLPVRSALVVQMAVLGASALLVSRGVRIAASGRTDPPESLDSPMPGPPETRDPAPDRG